MNTKVLLVEDDEWLAEQFVGILTRAGYETYHALHGVTAIDLVDDVRPQVIILDMLLTGTTGMALLHELQSHHDLASIPVIICSNMVSSLSLDTLTPYGVRRLVDKTTMEPSDLVAAVRSSLL